MANDYVAEIENRINAIKMQINTALKNLYAPKSVVSKERWLKSTETSYVNTVASLVRQYKSVVENMKQNRWGIDYKSGIIDRFNQFILGTNSQYRYFRDGYTESLIDSNSYGKVNQSTYDSIFKTKQSIYEARISTVKSYLELGDYLNAMSIGFVELHFSMWAIAESRHMDVAGFLERKKAYYRLSRYFCMDVLCAECYFYKKVNKLYLVEGALNDYFNHHYVDKMLKDLNTLSSALNWMGISSGESMVLKYMEEHHYPLNQVRKDRLKQLNQTEQKEFLDQFDISSGNQIIQNEIESMRNTIKHSFNRMDKDPISYEMYLKTLPKYGEICLVSAALKVIKDENKYSTVRDRLSDAELRRLEELSYRYTYFKNKAISFAAESMYDYESMNQQYMYEVMLCSDTEIKRKLNEINRILDMPADEKNWQTVWNLDLNEIIKWAWYYAMHASIEDFMNVKSLFYRLKRYFSIDLLICNLELIVRTQGKEVVQFAVESYMKNADCCKSQRDLEVLSAFLKHHNLQTIEKNVLKYMVDHQLSLDLPRSKRLYYLNNHKENAPKQFEVASNEKVSDEKMLHFDVSSVKWREDDVNDFFKELELNHKVLDYSLAVSMEETHLMLAKGIVLPQPIDLCLRLNQDYEDEYEEQEVVSRPVKATVLSEINEEITGIQVQIRECPSMNLLVHLMKIGKKLNIRFYTLYTPVETDRMAQKNQCLALIKKVSPSMGVWERSVKDSTLMSLQHILNTPSDSVHQKQKTKETEF